MSEITLSWVRMPRYEAIRSPCGRFVLTGGQGGAFGPYVLRDDKEGRSYRSRTLEGVKVDLREIRDREES